MTMKKRIIIKLSGEALRGSSNDMAIDPLKVREVAKEIKAA